MDYSIRKTEESRNIFSLNNLDDESKPWSIRLKPKPDELLTSWIIRLAWAHGIKLHVFCRLIWGSQTEIWTRDFDRLADSVYVEYLSQKTATPLTQANQTLLRSFEGVVFEKHNPYGNTHWIMPLGIRHRIRMAYGQQYCPLCLEESPYLKKTWRMAFSTVCSKHQILLFDRCPQCQFPIHFHRIDMGNRHRLASLDLHYCYRCKCDLRRPANTRPKSLLEVMSIQNQFENFILTKKASVGPHANIHSLEYFNGIRQLLRLLLGIRNSDNFQKEIARLTNTPFIPIKKSHSNRIIEVKSVEERFNGILTLSRLLQDWPKTFLKACQMSSIYKCHLTQDCPNPPTWYSSILDRI